MKNNNKKIDDDKSFFEKYMPNFLKNMSSQKRIITIVMILMVIIGISYASFVFMLSLLTKYMYEIGGVIFSLIVVYFYVKSGWFKTTINWIFLKDKNKKILLIMSIMIVAKFTLDLDAILTTSSGISNQMFIANFVDVTFVYIMILLYLNLFTVMKGIQIYKLVLFPFYIIYRLLKLSKYNKDNFFEKTFFHEIKVMKYAKHFFLVLILVVFRAVFQHPVSAGIEQLLNIAVLALLTIMFTVYVIDTFIRENKEKKETTRYLLHIILYVSLITSSYFIQPFVAQQRMSTIKFEKMDYLPEKTYNEVPVDARLANIWMNLDLGQNTGMTIPDGVLKDDRLVYISDFYSVNFWEYIFPFTLLPTKGIKILSMENWDMKVITIENHSLHSGGLMYGHNTGTAVGKTFNPYDYIRLTTENSIRFIDSNNSSYSVELVSSLSSLITPYSVPYGLYIIPDKGQNFDFLFGAGEFISIKDAVIKYPFLKDQQIVPLNVVREISDSVQLLSGYIDFAQNQNVLIPDRDKFGNIITEVLYTTIDGHTGPFAMVQMKAKTTTTSDIVNGKKIEKKGEGSSTLQTWFFPLSYIGNDDITVFVYNNKMYNNTYPVKSTLKSSFLQGVYNVGYEAYGIKSVIRNNVYYNIASRVKKDDNIHTMSKNIALYSFLTNKVYDIENPGEMNEIIAKEF